MGAVAMLAGFELRRRWRGVVVLALLVGVVGAVVVSSIAGARRSDTALSRFNRSSRAADMQVHVPDMASPAQLRAFARVPGIAAFVPLHLFATKVLHVPKLAIAAVTDAKLATEIDRARIVAGRAASPSAIDEVTISEILAARLHIGVGGHLDVVSLSFAQLQRAEAGATNPGPPRGPRLRLRIVGIERRPFDLGDQGASGGVLVETPAFDRYYSSRIGVYETVLRVRIRLGKTSEARIVAAARPIFAKEKFFDAQSLANGSESARSAIDVLTVALLIFAGVAALAGFVTIAIVLGREISLAGFDQTTLRALGLTRRQRVGVNGYPALLITGGGALLAGLGAVAASPLFPIGVARRADPDVGVHVDWAVEALGLVAIVAVVLAIAFVASLRSSGSPPSDARLRRRAATIAELAAGISAPAPATNGLRMALEPGSGSTAVPVRSAYFGAVFGIVGLTAVLMFTSSLDHLTATPRLYGWTADFAITDVASVDCGRADFDLTHTAGIVAVAAVCGQNVQIDGRAARGFAFTPLRATIAPELVAGRLPRRTHEVALGSVTLHRLGKHIGDTVQAAGPKTKFEYRIVGRVVFPRLANSQTLADGATFTRAGLHRIHNPSDFDRYLLVRFAPGADRAKIERHIAANPNLTGPTRRSIPPEVDRLRQIGWFPVTLAALLGGLALLAVGHALVTSVRRRRRDLALLKTLGFNRRQVRATVAWQATTLGTVGLIIGIPAGLIVGNFVWRLVADGIGVSTAAVIPVLALLLVIPGALALVNVLAYLPARAAAQTRPAVALRTE